MLQGIQSPLSESWNESDVSTHLKNCTGHVMAMQVGSRSYRYIGLKWT